MTDDQDNDVVLEPEEAPENKAHEKLLEKVETLKAELAKVKGERQEYLDGWQRMRADVVNMKREQAASLERMQSAIKEEVIADIIPILDSFDSAMQGEAWNDVSESWRKGVEYIRSQCLAVLEKHGITAFGAVGEPFDHHVHEPIQEIEDANAASGTLLRVTRRGYKVGARLIRPAQVVVAK